MIEIQSEEEKCEQLRRDGVTKLGNLLLLVTNLVEDPDDALKFAETIGAFSESPLDAEMERRNEVKASLEMEGGRLQASFRLDGFKLSFRNKAGGTASYSADFSVKDIQSGGPFLSFVLDDGETVRAVRENETISIDHFAFDLYPI